MVVQFELEELLRDRDEELKLHKKTERHLTQADIRHLVEDKAQEVEGKASLPTGPSQRSGDETES